MLYVIAAIRTPPAGPAEWLAWGGAVLTMIVGLVLIPQLPSSRD
jgi:hypothetical protein